MGCSYRNKEAKEEAIKTKERDNDEQAEICEKYSKKYITEICKEYNK